MTARLVLAAAGAGIGAEVLRRARQRQRQRLAIPATVNTALSRQLRGMAVNPCSGERANVATYSELFVLQKTSLERQFGSMQGSSCGLGGFGACIAQPSKSIPTASVTCTLSVVDQWRHVAQSVELDAGDVGRLLAVGGDMANLKLELQEYDRTLGILAGFARGIGQSAGMDARLTGDTNRRIWSTIGRLSIALAGVHITNGDAAGEAAGELGRTLTNPASYTEAAGDLAGAVLGVVADVAGEAAGRFLASNLGAIAVVAGAGYFVLRRSL